MREKEQTAAPSPRSLAHCRLDLGSGPAASASAERSRMADQIFASTPCASSLLIRDARSAGPGWARPAPARGLEPLWRQFGRRLDYRPVHVEAACEPARWRNHRAVQPASTSFGPRPTSPPLIGVPVEEQILLSQPLNGPVWLSSQHFYWGAPWKRRLRARARWLYSLWAGSPGAEGEFAMADSASYGELGKKSVCSTELLQCVTPEERGAMQCAGGVYVNE